MHIPARSAGEDSCPCRVFGRAIDATAKFQAGRSVDSWDAPRKRHYSRNVLARHGAVSQPRLLVSYGSGLNWAQSRRILLQQLHTPRDLDPSSRSWRLAHGVHSQAPTRTLPLPSNLAAHGRQYLGGGQPRQAGVPLPELCSGDVDGCFSRTAPLGRDANHARKVWPSGPCTHSATRAGADPLARTRARGAFSLEAGRCGVQQQPGPLARSCVRRCGGGGCWTWSVQRGSFVSCSHGLCRSPLDAGMARLTDVFCARKFQCLGCAVTGILWTVRT